MIKFFKKHFITFVVSFYLPTKMIFEIFVSLALILLRTGYGGRVDNVWEWIKP